MHLPKGKGVHRRKSKSRKQRYIVSNVDTVKRDFYFTVWAIIIAHCYQTWLQFVLTMIPIMQIFRGATWVATWEPNVMWFVSVITGVLADFAVKSGTSTATVRKFCNTLGFCGPIITLVFLHYAKDEVWTTIFFIAMGLNATSVCGFQINHIDLSPRYAGFLMAISSFFASIVNIIVFYTLSNLAVEWNTILYSAIGTSIVGNVIFVVYGKAKVQHWNN